MMTGNKSLAIFNMLCAQQGKKKKWVAAQAGLTGQALSKRLRNKHGYPWKPGEREAIAKALGVTVAVIWQETEPERAGVPV